MAAEYEVNIKINTQQIERDLKKVEKAVNNIGKGKGGKKQSVLALPSTEMLNATARKIQSLDKVNRKIELRQREISKQTRDQALNINTLVKTQDRRARLLNKINEMEAKGLNVSKLRKQLGKATTEQGKRRFGSAEKEFRILEKSLRLEQSKLRILKAQRKGFPASPVRGVRSMMGSPAQISASGRQAADPIKGRADLVGSPAYYEAQQKAIDRLARQGGASDPIKGHPNLVGSPKYFEAQQKEIDKAARQGGATNPLRGSKNLPGSPAYFDHLNRDISKLARQGGASSPIRGNKNLIGSPAYYEHQRKELERLARRGGPSSPIGGAANIPGSPRARKAGMDRLGQVALGAGFPLLFGGGAGSVIGGAAGGLTGSFGAQIGLSALGQQADQLLASTVKTAESVNSVGGALDFLRERSLFSSKETEELAKKLENQGDLTGVAALVTEELNDALGPGGIQKMQDLAEQTKLAKQQWGELTTNLELLISGPLAEFLKIVNATLGIKVAQSQFARSFSELKQRDPQRAAALMPSMQGSKNPVIGGLSSLAFGPNMAGGVFDMQGLSEGALIDFTSQMNNILKSMGVKDAALPITEEDRKRFRSGSGVDKAAKEEERLQKRLAKLEEERQKVIEISRFKDRIAAAEAADDAQLVIRLQGEQKMAEIEASRKQALVGITDQREIERINIGKATEKLANQRETERQITEEQRKRQELFQDTVADLEHQLALAQATSEAERERLRIEKKLQELREDGMSEGQIGKVGDLLKQISAENSPLNQFINQSIESLNNLEARAVQVSEGIGNAIGNSLVSGMRGLITGATSVKEVFANMLSSIADVLAQQAANMIATYISIGIARIFAGIGSAGAAPTGAAAAPASKAGTLTTGPLPNLGSGPSFGSVSDFAPATILPAARFAQGGFVSSPTSALIGEGGESEYVVPASKMNEAMGRYARGARGGAVIPDGSGGDAGGEMGGGGGSIDVNYSVERINNVNYVTAAEFEKGMAQAAKRGAELGKRGVYSDLINKRSVRSRVSV